MDYEKKYNEALEWMRDIYPTMEGFVKEDAEHYFPELREGQENNVIDIPFGAHGSELKGWEYTIPEGMEAIIKDGKVIVKEKASEDERIRRQLINVCNDWLNGDYSAKPCLNDMHKEIPMSDSTKMIKMWDEEKKILERMYLRGDTWRLIAYNAFIDGLARGNLVKFEKQKEQKPTNSEKPKEWSEEDEAMIKRVIERIEAERLKSRIMDIISSIDNLEEEISRYLSDKREADTMLLGIETKIAQEQENEDSEIMQYFLCNKKLQLNTVNDSIMTFSCEDYLTYFDEEMAKSMIDNPRSYVYVPNGRACNNYIKAEDMKRLMYAIFIDQTLRIKFCAAYQFELGRRVRALSGFDYDSNFKNCMPNPHTDHYSCMGNYEREITNRIRENDYIGAIEQAIASCKSLNFGDSTVMKRFIEQMYGLDGYTHNVCVELPDGKFVTPKEAAEFLKNKEEKGKEQADE